MDEKWLLGTRARVQRNSAMFRTHMDTTSRQGNQYMSQHVLLRKTFTESMHLNIESFSVSSKK
jgi:hypothetical protein